MRTNFDSLRNVVVTSGTSGKNMTGLYRNEVGCIYSVKSVEQRLRSTKPRLVK